jgi:hypothetical protein
MSTHLISPFVNERHIDVVNEHSHLLASRRTVGCSHALVHIALYCPLHNSNITYNSCIVYVKCIHSKLLMQKNAQ